MKKLISIIIILSLFGSSLTFAEDLTTEALIQDVETDGSEASASWFYVFEDLLKDKALNGIKFYRVLESLRQPNLENQIESVLNQDNDRKALLLSYGFDAKEIFDFMSYYMSTFPESMAKMICCGSTSGINIYGDMYFDEDISYSKYMVRFHIYLNDLFLKLPPEMQTPIKKYDRLNAGEIIVMQKLINVIIRDYVAVEVYDTENGDIISRDLKLRSQIRALLITELTSIANTYDDAYANDPTKDKTVNSEEIEDYVDALIAFTNVMLESVELNAESSDLMDSVFELTTDANLLLIVGQSPSNPTPRTVDSITLVMNTDFVELDSSIPLTSGFVNTFKLIPTVTGTNNPVVYSSENPSLVSVDSDGNIEIGTEKSGLVSIFATIQGYDVYREIRVQVSEETPRGAIKFLGPYISGYPDLSFKSTNYITRAEIATMFGRVLGLDYIGVNKRFVTKEILTQVSYDDVNKDHWAYVYVELANINGLLFGYEDGTFKPNEPITRAEIAVVVSNAWELLEIESNELANHIIYDVSSEYWAFDAINKVYNANIVYGYDDGTFRPEQFTTRAEIVVMINKIIERKNIIPIENSFNDIPKSHWAYGFIEAAIRIQEVKFDIPEN